MSILSRLAVVIELLAGAACTPALAGFFVGYSALTGDAYAFDLRMFTAWCQQHGLHLFQVRRADIECFGRDVEARGRARATIARRLCTMLGGREHEHVFLQAEEAEMTAPR